MQLQITANSLNLNTRESQTTAGQQQPAVSGTVLPSSLSSSETSQASPVTKPVSPAAAGVSISSRSSEEPTLKGDERSAAPKSSEPDAQREEQQLIRDLAALDREVRQHELSHAAVGGQYAGAPTFDYERGPDGRLYAIGGEVSIDTSKVSNDPAATLEKAEVIIRAALAVADPSPQDRAVAARAAAMASEARAELAQQGLDADESAGSKIEAEQLREKRRSEERQDKIKEQQDQSASQAEKLQDFRQQLEVVNEKFAEINLKLLDAGVFKKLFSEGAIFDEIV